MGIIGYINVVLETYGAVFSLLVVAFLTVGQREADPPRSRLVRLLVCNAAVLLCDVGSWMFEGRTDPLGRFAMEATTLGMFVLAYVRLAFFTDYIEASIVARGRNLGAGLVRFMWAACALASLLAVVSLFNGMFYRIDAQGMYVRGPWIGLSQWFGILCILVNGYLLVRNRGAFLPRELLVLGLCVAFPAVALVFQQALYGISFLNIATTIVAVCLYLGVQMERERAIREQKLNLERYRAQLALGEMQPKFLLGTLDTIHELCQDDPPAAKEALEEFAIYLRANTDALSSAAPIPLELELRQVRSYLSLEQRRLGNRLDVEYAVEATDFAIPALSLQFLAERAVRRRCGEGDGRCTMRISARDEGTACRVSVLDAGTPTAEGRAACQAPDPAVPGEQHTFTVESMRKRVALLQGGMLETAETPAGHEASIVVPKTLCETGKTGRG